MQKKKKKKKGNEHLTNTWSYICLIWEMFATVHLKTDFTWDFIWHYNIGMWGIFVFASQKSIMFSLLKTFI